VVRDVFTALPAYPTLTVTFEAPVCPPRVHVVRNVWFAR
jgi:hypothetical protein